jgi:DNA adenine methylase
MRSISSPLRYPGSKKRLVRYIHKVLDFNEFSPTVIVEPFVGGGSISLNFLARNPSHQAVIADKDKLVYSFWKVLFSSPAHLINFVKETPINLDLFRRYKKIATQSEKYSEKTLAETCLFLNRTSFSGLTKPS